MYNVEVELQGLLHKIINVPGPYTDIVSVKSTPLEIGALELIDPPGMKWESLVLSVATDPRILTAGLQEQIDDLQAQISALLYALQHHTHDYLTGKGQGHNNTTAVTSTPWLPAVDGADAADLDDATTIVAADPGPLSSDPAEGLAGFCGTQNSKWACKAADWQGDEPGIPRPYDCAWSNGRCIAQ